MLKPLSSARWNLDAAAHLLNRAGFGGPPEEIETLADLGHDQAVAALLDYERIPDGWPDPAWARPDPGRMERLRDVHRRGSAGERKQAQRDERKLQFRRMLELRGWWLKRMARGPRPFQEKMVLFWHGHFATSVVKVRDAYYMWRQNELFRRRATGNWQELLTEAGKDPAMLIWLDQATSRRPHANENFAREVMELFSLGEGHYTEREMTEAARALTGWSLDRIHQCYIYRPYFHDNGAKTFFGHTGNLNGDDVIRIIVEQPQAARFITGKLWNYFTGQPPSGKLNDALAAVFRGNGSNFKPLLRVMFRSGEFYDASVVRNQVKSPVQWLVGTARVLQCDLPPALVCRAMTRNLGQDLFAPPNVKGWDGGIAWITTNTLFSRYNGAATLVQGTLEPLAAGDFTRKPGRPAGKKIKRALQRIHVGGVDLANLFTPAERADKSLLVVAIERRLLQRDLNNDQERALREFLASRGRRMADWEIREAIRLVMATPDYQVT